MRPKTQLLLDDILDSCQAINGGGPRMTEQEEMGGESRRGAESAEKRELVP